MCIRDRLRDVDFSFLKATSPPVLGDLVLSEFNGGIQQVAAQESLLYLPNFIEFKAIVRDDMTFSVDCMTGKGVPGYLCIFCRDSDELLEQPIIKRLSLQNLTTMKKSDSVIDTDVHELYHMTQRNVHPRSEYDSKAFNKRQTLLLAIEDIGIMGMLPAPETGPGPREWALHQRGYGHGHLHLQQPRALRKGSPAVGRAHVKFATPIKKPRLRHGVRTRPDD